MECTQDCFSIVPWEFLISSLRGSVSEIVLAEFPAVSGTKAVDLREGAENAPGRGLASAPRLPGEMTSWIDPLDAWNVHKEQ